MAALNPEYLTALYHTVNTSAYPSHMLMRLVAVEPGRSVVELEIAQRHLQPFGIVHGGVIATLIDTATFWAGFSIIPEKSGLVNVDLKLNYLAPASTGILIARGETIRAGRTIGYAEARVATSDGTLIAHGTSTLMALPGKGLDLGVPKFL
jgi:uncharacterized protein (TIGR00369 family)